MDEKDEKIAAMEVAVADIINEYGDEFIEFDEAFEEDEL